MIFNKKLKRLICILTVLIVVIAVGFQVNQVYRRTAAYFRINSYIEKGSYKECIRYIDGLIKKDPGNYYYYSRKGYSLMKLNKPAEALKVLKQALALKPDDGIILNNLSWVHYKLGNYKDALEYSRRSLAITPNDPVTLTNQGNALRKLGQMKEALSAYIKAVKFDPSSDIAIYGKALTEFDLKNFKSAADTFTIYNRLVKEDADSYLYLGEAYYFLSQYENSIKALSHASKLAPKNVESYYYIGFCYNDQEKYHEAINVYDEAIKIAPNDPEAYYQRGRSYYFNNEFKESLKSLDMAIKLDPKYPYPYSWEARNYLKIKNYKAALDYADKAVSLNPGDSYPYNIKARIYYGMGKSSPALNTINKAIRLEPDYNELYITKALILYGDGSFRECINFIENLFNKDKFKDDSDLRWYLGDSYSAIDKHSIAIQIYEKLSKELTKDDEIFSDLGWEYYYTQDYEKAETLSNKALSLNPGSQDAKSLLKNIKYSKQGDNIKITDFVENNYLYLNKSKHFSSITKRFRAKKNPSTEDIVSYLSSIVYRGDRFTYFLNSKYYDDFINREENKHMSTSSFKSGFITVRIPSFGADTGDEVEKYLLSQKNTENITLIFDLRNNSGGLITGANEILDLLLPKCVMSYLVYRDGYKFSYTSDSRMLKFKKIIVMVNENSASSSELMALSLRKHLSNVTIIGHKTFGKGVGQETFENKSKRYIILLTSFYWFVENVNISNTKITPDVIIKGSSDKDFYNYVNTSASN